MTLEGYYKISHNLAVVNENKYLESDPDLIPGSGEAYGMEFQQSITGSREYHRVLFIDVGI